MKNSYRLLVINEQSASVSEYRVSSRQIALAIWGLVGAGVTLLGVAAALLWASKASAAESGSTESRTEVGAQRLAPAQSLTIASEGATPHSLSAGLLRSAFAPVERAQARLSVPPGPCDENMVLVDGEYCPQVHQRCLRFTDPEGSALYGQRCAEYESPVRCLSPVKKSMHFCIDREEFVASGQELPRTSVSAEEAQVACESMGKRLCTEEEWTFACEGEESLPYPYGFARSDSRCNTDRSDLVAADGSLKDGRQKAGSFPQCESPFGVRDLSGNVEEYVSVNLDGKGFVRKGSYWQPGANHCRASQPHPDTDYRGIEVGFRCCAAARKTDAP